MAASKLSFYIAIAISSACIGCSFDTAKSPRASSAKKDSEKQSLMCSAAKKMAPDDLYKESIGSIAVVIANDSQGSGFVVRQDKRYTYLLTNSHVVDGSNNVSVKWSDGRKENAEVVADFGGITRQKDLALLKIDAIRGKPLAFKNDSPPIGGDVIVIGSPQGLEFSLTRGVLSQVRNNGDFLQIDAPVNPGNSGGPVFDAYGCIIGVVTFKAEDSEGLNFAIASAPVKHFLANPSIERTQTSSELQISKSYYEPPLINFDESLNVPKPEGFGWSFSHAKCSPYAKDYVRPLELCFDNDDVDSSRVKLLVLSDKVKQKEFRWYRYDGRRGNFGHLSTTYTNRTRRPGNEIDTYTSARADRIVIDCKQWLYAFADSMEFSPVLPKTYLENHAIQACKKGQLVESEAKGHSNVGPSIVNECDQKADSIFYKKYPHLGGLKIADSESALAKEWAAIRSNVCP